VEASEVWKDYQAALKHVETIRALAKVEDAKKAETK
jgi:hypothetical protein